jgi:hypothetical protein
LICELSFRISIKIGDTAFCGAFCGYDASIHAGRARWFVKQIAIGRCPASTSHEQIECNPVISSTLACKNQMEIVGKMGLAISLLRHYQLMINLIRVPSQIALIQFTN